MFFLDAWRADKNGHSPSHVFQTADLRRRNHRPAALKQDASPAALSTVANAPTPLPQSTYADDDLPYLLRFNF